MKGDTKRIIKGDWIWACNNCESMTSGFFDSKDEAIKDCNRRCKEADEDCDCVIECDEHDIGRTVITKSDIKRIGKAGFERYFKVEDLEQECNECGQELQSFYDEILGE